MPDSSIPATTEPMNIAEMKAHAIVAAMGGRGLDLNVQAGIQILRGYGEGSLLSWPAITKHLVEHDGTLYMRWRDLVEAVDADDPGLVYLSSTARTALELACALAVGRPIQRLGYRLCNFDQSNATVVLHALSIPLHTTIEASGWEYR